MSRRILACNELRIGKETLKQDDIKKLHEVVKLMLVSPAGTAANPTPSDVPPTVPVATDKGPATEHVAETRENSERAVDISVVVAGSSTSTTERVAVRKRGKRWYDVDGRVVKAKNVRDKDTDSPYTLREILTEI